MIRKQQFVDQNFDSTVGSRINSKVTSIRQKKKGETVEKFTRCIGTTSR